MCGIAGILWHKFCVSECEHVLKNMTKGMRNRGPDDSGQWQHPAKSVAFAHTRLAIQDLSQLGHQPMISSSGRYVIVFNGEIYNYKRLSQLLCNTNENLENCSDTKVMLAAIEAWGLEKAVSSFIGMFAFALWDNQTQKLTLVRDRLGIKPLFYGKINQCFVFASELKPFFCMPEFSKEIDNTSLTLFLRTGTIGYPRSIYKNIWQLPPGSMLTIDYENSQAITKPVQYWSVSSSNYQFDNQQDILEQANSLLSDAVNLRMIADVPIGTFLSGGIDSSLISAIAQSQSSTPIKTFSIGFYEEGYNEAHYAKEIANYLGTQHTECYISTEDALNIIPEISCYYDQPFADASEIPTLLVSKIARQHVTVALSGDGGDELFCGYERYLLYANLWKKIQAIPRPARYLLAKALSVLPTTALNRFSEKYANHLPKSLQFNYLGNKIEKAIGIFMRQNFSSCYEDLLANWSTSSQALMHPINIETGRDYATDVDLNLYEQMMLDDLNYYLPNDILTKVDRASMAYSLETRVPILDHRFVEFSWLCPFDYKLKANQPKWLLRQLLKRYIPEHLYERPKKGFGVPIETWLRTHLKEWASDLLSKQRLARQGIFNPSLVEKLWQEHLSCQHDHKTKLWSLLMFQTWYEQYQK